VFEQTEETFAYLQLCNQNRSVIDGLARTDYWDYPKDAIREALINAIIHRDYSFSGSIIINVNDKRMEFISIGGLLPGLAPEDIRNGISQLRNRKLAEAFHRLNFIESYGTGIRRIFALYEDCKEKPEITVTPNSFKITLPNINAAADVMPANVAATTPQMQVLLDYLAEHKEISDAGIQNLLNIKRTRAYTLTRRMIELGLIKTEGRGDRRKYFPLGAN
jgi:ATP-dependent DNA helicase RecG